MPPSSDDLPGRTPPQRRPRRGGGRGPGKQPGAPGAYLAWREVPDKTEDLFPQGGCACGADLAASADLGVRYSHQVMDVPQARAQTTQYDRHEVACACGRRHVAGAPPEAAGAPGTVTYGLNFQAWCVFLLVMHHVPVERCADILESMSGTRPSDGWVHTLLARAARAVAAANTAIRALIILDTMGPTRISMRCRTWPERPASAAERLRTIAWSGAMRALPGGESCSFSSRESRVAGDEQCYQCPSERRRDPSG
jgi:transposase